MATPPSPTVTSALRQATHAAMDGLDLEDAAENLPELRGALDTWGTETPR